MKNSNSDSSSATINAFARRRFLRVLIGGVTAGFFVECHPSSQRSAKSRGSGPVSSLISRIKVLTKNGGRVDWSHANDRIVFDRAGDDGYFDVWTMNADGTKQVSLTAGKAGLPQRHNGNPAWHPSGRYIVFQAQKSGIPRRAERTSQPGAGVLNDLWLMTADGDKFWKLHDVHLDISKNAPGVLHPHFTHNGKRLLWSERLRAGGGPFGEWALKLADFTMASERPRLENIRTYQPGGAAFYESHGFSSDNNRFLFTSNQDRGRGLHIYEFDLRTERERRLTDGIGVWNEHAQYTPDGRHILWMSSRGLTIRPRLKTEYWIMKSDSSEKQQLTSFNTQNSTLFGQREALVAADSAWGPDGRRLVALVIDADPSSAKRDQGQIVLIEFTKEL